MKPNKDVLESKRHGFPWKFLNWRKERRQTHLITVNRVREQSIRILQNRYGYNREQATYQLDKYYSKAWLG